MKIVEVKNYAVISDVYVLVTDSIWVNEKISKLININLSDFKDDNSCAKAYRYLKNLGFKKVESESIEVGGNL